MPSLTSQLAARLAAFERGDDSPLRDDRTLAEISVLARQIPDPDTPGVPDTAGIPDVPGVSDVPGVRDTLGAPDAPGVAGPGAALALAATVLVTRHQLAGVHTVAGDAEGLAAVALYRRAAGYGAAIPDGVAVISAGSWETVAGAWAAAAADLLERAFHDGDAGSRDQAIRLLYAVDIVTPPDEIRPAQASNLAAALSARYEAGRRRFRWEIDEAVRFACFGTLPPPDADPEAASRLSTLSLVLNRRFNGLRDPADLDAAIDAGRAAADATGRAEPLRARYLTNLAMTLTDRFELTGRITDLDEAREHARAAVDGPMPGTDRVAVLSNAGVVSNTHAQYTGDPGSLAMTVDVLTRAVEACGPQHPLRARCLANLSSALVTRYDMFGALADIDTAVDAAREAASATGPEHPNLASRWTNLGTAARIRYLRTQEPADLDTAVDAARRAAAASADHPGARRTIHLSNLGTALLTRFEVSGGHADLDEAIAAHTGAADAAEENLDVTVHATALHNLARAHAFAWRARHDPAALALAQATARRAVARAPATHPDRPLYLTEYATYLLETPPGTAAVPSDAAGHASRRDSGRDPRREPGRRPPRSEVARIVAPRAEAVRALREAAGVMTAPADTRIRAARRLARLEAGMGRWGPAAEVLTGAVELLARAAWPGVERPDQEHRLRQVTGLASDAAAARLTDEEREHAVEPGEGVRATEPPRRGRAVELLEQGRGVLHGQMLDRRADLAALEGRVPALAARLREVAAGLDAAAGDMPLP
ncbi:hypothetical protein [Sphaerisporangium aureirubrum]|uniref:Tetratricopeptide repeat protein n=1 Tax=Sphaerisporangium aureirubrum TaxID=1544736 RepID=A0ABW1NIB5_9ACTN